MLRTICVCILLLISAVVHGQNIVRFEYFFDADPGFGSGTPVNVAPSLNITNLDVPISTASLSPGFHRLYIRAQTDANKWTHTQQRSIYIVPFNSPPQTVSQVEYFIDTDPGVGLATQVSFSASATVTNIPIDVSMSSLSPGLHRVYVRARSSDGRWTHTHSRSFFVARATVGQNLVKFEYFFDNDPGFDAGKPLAISPPLPSVNNQDILIDVSALSVGAHTIYIRAKDSGGEWTQLVSAAFSVTPPALPVISNFTPTSGAASSVVTINGTNFGGTTAVAFGGTNAASFTVLSSTIITAVVGTGASGPISVTTAAGTATSSTNYTFLGDLISIPTQPVSSGVCEGTPASFTLVATGTSNLAFQWQKFDGTSFIDLSDSGPVTGTTTSSLSINTTGQAGSAFYRCKISGDNSIDKYSDTVTLIVNTVPAPPITTNASACGPSALTITASGGTDGQYRWYDVASGGTALVGGVNSSFTTPVLVASSTYYVSLANTFCESARTAATASILNSPPKPTITASSPISGGIVELCLNSVTLAEPLASSYLWSDGQTTQTISVSNAGTYSVVVSNPNGCSSVVSDELEVVANPVCSNSPPVLTVPDLKAVLGQPFEQNLSAFISDPDDNLSPGSITVPGNTTQKGGKVKLTSFTLGIDYTGLDFSGNDAVTIRICDQLNACVQQDVSIEIIRDLVIYDAVSPNGDGKNDAWIIENIDLLPGTRSNVVRVYNRWGDLVWEGVNYDNKTVVFSGRSSNGKELPSGSYFYKLQFQDQPGSRSTTGYILLRK